MNVEVLGTDESQAWFLDLSVEEQAAVVNVVTPSTPGAAPSS